MLVICPIFDRAELLPFYLKHYWKMGATKIVLALWKGERNPHFEFIENFFSDDVIMRTSMSVDRKDYNGPVESASLNNIREEFQQESPWQCVADLDEFCWFDGLSMSAMADEASQRGYTAVHGTLFDRFARNETFPPIPVGGSLDETYPLQGDMTRCAGICIDKYPLYRSDIPIQGGHHTTIGNAWMDQIEVHHFKWTAGVKERLHERAVRETAQGHPWGGETLRPLGYIDRGGYVSDPNYRWHEARKLGL